jgi:hypothetical protein
MATSLNLLVRDTHAAGKLETNNLNLPEEISAPAPPQLLLSQQLETYILVQSFT